MADAPAVEDQGGAGLKQRVLRGGAFMVGRQMISIALGVLSAFLILRLIGPKSYGAYTAAAGIYQYVLNLSQSGIAVYLIRAPDQPSKRHYDVASTILLLLAIIMVAALAMLGRLIGAWAHIPGFQPLIAVLALCLPLQGLTLSASAQLERALDFRRVAMIETGGQIASYLVIIPFVLTGFGAWALVAGFFVQQASVCAAFLICSGYRPRLAWDAAICRKMFRYSIGYTAADWVWQLRNLVNPLLVGHFLGPVAVGQIGLSIRLLETLSFARAIAWRLSIASLAKIQNTQRLIDATTQGMQLQMLAVGPLLLGFGWFGEILLPQVFGQRWAPVMTLYPFLALSYLTNCQFNVHSSALYVKQHNLDVARFHLVNVLIFAGVTWWAVQRWGLIGYGWGEAAALVSYGVLHAAFVRRFGWPNYRVSAIWWLTLAIGLFWRTLGPWAFAAPFVGLLWPSSLQTLRGYAAEIRGRRIKLAIGAAAPPSP